MIPGSNPGAPARFVPDTVTDSTLAAVVMAGGLGTRMRSAVPKHLHLILGRRMVDWVLEAAWPLGPAPLVVIASPDSRDAFGETKVAIQEQPRGTGDAVRSARAAVGDEAESLLVLSGDTPLLTAELLGALVETHRRRGRPPRRSSPSSRSTSVPTAGSSARPTARSRRSSRSATRHPSSSSCASATPRSTSSAPRRSGPRSNDSSRTTQGELYLTDAVRGLVGSGERVVAHVAPDPAETEGVNTRAELAAAAAALRDRINAAHMDAGVAILDPATT